MQRIVINVCYGGFGLSEAAYERLIELGIPRRKYVEQERGADGLYRPEPKNDGEVIFDRDLDDSPTDVSQSVRRLTGRYWDDWTRGSRTHPLLLQVVEELGDAANGMCAKLIIVEIPDGVEWEIDEYDGIESVDEVHRSWS